ncbi:hypothetical protein MAR_012597 [Mya arenaria]|uniref:Uncharacterized protein n=1 Tax=Mya arenaria TaxID=6604 RepID=A0ABY7FXG3_MYAAR|nr:hypothetical protein MAR_012597 [Mya arenaria]
MPAQHIHQGNKQNMLFVNSDVYAQLRPRNVDRKERHPGACERNSNKRQRLQDKRKIPPENAPRSRATEPQFHPTYSHDSAVKDFGRHETCSEQNEQQKVTSYYQELSTIEAIRKKDNIDNLSDSKKDYLEAVPNENIHQEKAKSVPIPDNKKREVYADTSVWPKQNKSARPLSNTFRIATPFSAGWTNTEDTAMQPKSKKYINQMLTFHHMKHHEQKIRLAKPTDKRLLEHVKQFSYANDSEEIQ